MARNTFSDVGSISRNVSLGQVTDMFVAGERFFIGAGDTYYGSQESNSFNDCFAQCTNDGDGCTAAEWSGGADTYGIGAAVCYYYRGSPIQFTDQGYSSFVVMVKREYYQVYT